MKKFFYLAMMTFVALGITACGDDKDETVSSLKGTEWVYAESETESEEGVTYVINIEALLKFTTATEGSLDITMEAVYNGAPFYSDSDSEAFTYTYNNGKGTMSSTDEDAEVSTIPFTVNGNELTLSEVDEETGEEISIVFTRK